MTTIGGTGGSGGSPGTGGTGGSGGHEPRAGDDIAGAAADPAEAATTALDPVELGRVDGLRALAADLAARGLAPGEATRTMIDHLVETAGPELDAAARAELHELLTDLVTNDPYLGGLVERM